MGRKNDPFREVKGRQRKNASKETKPRKKNGGALQVVTMAMLCAFALASVAGIFMLTGRISDSLHAGASQTLQDTSDTVRQRYAMMTMMMTASQSQDGSQDVSPTVPPTQDGNDYVHQIPGDEPSVTPDDPEPPIASNPVTQEPSDGQPIWADRTDGADYVYVIKRGDTLSSISGEVGYYVEQLAEYNDISNVNLIYAGASLRVPVENYKARQDAQ